MKILCENCDFGISVADGMVCEKSGVFYNVKKECKEMRESREEINSRFEEWEKRQRDRFESWYENELMSWDKDKREDWLFDRWLDWEENVNWKNDLFNYMDKDCG